MGLGDSFPQPMTPNPGMRPHTRPPSKAPQTIPPHPLALDGSAVLHQMFRVRRAAWNRTSERDRALILGEAEEHLAGLEGRGASASAAFSILGHKGDLLLLHFRPDFSALGRAERAVQNLRLYSYLEATSSYVSVVELGLYDSSVKLYREMLEEGVEVDSEEWKQRVKARLAEQAAAMAPRLKPSVPGHRYLCFYPMDKKRGERHNWYSVPIEERRRMMRDHGMIGRRFAGRVRQIISGSIGFDDWEWGVDLFADDPLVFKQLIYEMRFDEASALYALFGPFYICERIHASGFGDWLMLAD